MKRYPDLDGLRGIAVLLVLFRHAAREYVNHTGDEALWLRPLLNGWIGVDLFFVLSGFLIATNVLAAVVDEGLPLRAYLWRRVRRIVPAYYVVLLVVAGGCLPFFPPPEKGLWISVAYHLLFLQDYLPANIVVAFWSLGVEEKFYLLVPGLLIPLARARLGIQLAVVAGLGVLPPVLRYLTWQAHPEITTYAACFGVLRSPFHLAADGMAVGVMIALLIRAGVELKPSVRAGLFATATAVIFGLLSRPFLLESVSFWSVVALFVVLAWTFGAMVLASVSGPTFASPILGHPALGWVGRVSYSLYLVHMLFLGVSYRQFGHLGFLPFLGAFAMYTLVSALALHHLVERPGQGLAFFRAARER